MKKTVSLFLCLTMAISAAVCAGCSKDVQPMAEISDYNSEAYFPAKGDSQSAESESSNVVPDGGFVVRDRKYAYEGNDLVILNVENQTNQNYTVTINGAYLDESGEVLKEETQTFEGFEAGWQNYFLFQPNIVFDRFTYTLETEAYTGECIAARLEFGWVEELLEIVGPAITSYDDNGSAVWEPQKELYADLFFTVHGTMPMEFCSRCIVLDSQGEIFTINSNWITTVLPPEETHEKAMILMEGLPSDEAAPIPEAVQDGFSILLAIKGAKWDPTWSQD